jgi:hypothetical protein
MVDPRRVGVGLSVTSRAQAVPQIKIAQAVDISNLFIGRSSIVLVQQLLWLPRCCRQHAEMVKESLRPCESGGWPCRIGPGSLASPTLSVRKNGAGQVEKIQVAEAERGVPAPDRRRSFSQGPGRARPAVFAVLDPASIMDAVSVRLRAIGEHVPRFGQFHIAVRQRQVND